MASGTFTIPMPWSYIANIGDYARDNIEMICTRPFSTPGNLKRPKSHLRSLPEVAEYGSDTSQDLSS